MAEPPTGTREDSIRLFAIALGGTALLGVIAYGLSILFGTPLAPQFKLTLRDALIGAGAAIPMIALLYVFMKTEHPQIAAFRESQIEFFANIGFEFTPVRILLMSLFAGVFEELLFRGVLQSGIDKIAPVAVAIIASNILFGVLHWRTALYALIAGVIGAWLGLIFWLTGNLLAPMIAHGFYDLVALAVTARAIRAARAN
ncbi:MAG: CPBP family intramembrane glutamic endopeptidase [Pseudomonadota bacterium]